MSPEAIWTAAGVCATLALALLAQLGMLIHASGKASADLGNLKLSVGAIHRRIDEHAEKDEKTASAVQDRIDTMHDNIGAQVQELTNALLSKGVIELHDITPNGLASHRGG